MTTHSARAGTHGSFGWSRRPFFALAVRVLTVAGPLLAGWFAVRALQSRFITAEGGAGVVFWVVQAIVVAVVATHIVSRLTSRLTPMVALLNMTLVFPDQAPSRFGLALRSGMGSRLADQTTQLSSDAQEAAVQALALVNSLGDHERLTRGHTERVRAYADLIGQEMGLNAEDLNKLRWGVLLHDIGKLRVDADVLNKPSKPNAEEWESLSHHPAAGMEILEPLREWLGPWMNAAGDHHERWDGAGYPQGLKGVEISLAGRITAVADAFDVITSTRSYKSALSSETAREELVRHAGTQFDPAIVRAFLRVGLKRRRSLGVFGWMLELPGVGQLASTMSAAPAVVTTSAAVVSVSVASLGAPALAAQPSSLAFGEEATEVVVASSTTTTTVGVTSDGNAVVVATTRPTPTPTTTTTTAVPTTSTTTTTTVRPATTTVAPTTTTTNALGPDAVSDSYVTENDDWNTMRVLNNDSTPLPLWSMEIVDLPKHAASIEVRSNFSIRYYIADGFVGTDTFSYRICDVADNCDTAQVTLRVKDD
ncbi:MAG: HD domain-containing protein [Acidimicrobiales bacterium]|nr:HD domain-containing protein [Acidimicrobiales bacterium]RZV48229.1 MAG: HD-GYP domain-containing protein [Acidimicrobiales bacterium]